MLIVTIIVIIILAAVVILTVGKNNPVESAREATFKEDLRSFQDDLALSISKDYISQAGQRDNKFSATDFDQIKDYIPSFTKEYEGKFIIENDKLVGTDKLTEKENIWTKDLNIYIPIELKFDPEEWDKTAASDDCFYWHSNNPEGFNHTYAGIKEYNTIFAYKEGLKDMTTLKIPSRCIAIYYPNMNWETGSEYLANIKNIELPNTVQVIGKFAFYRCVKLTNITIPNSVRGIDSWAFEQCVSLEKLTIPNSITWMGGSVFQWCYSLTNINFQGTMEEWNNINKDGGWRASSSIKTITCTDGIITF